MRHPPGPTVAIVADDMTGAADCALAFGETGWRAHLELGDGWTPFPGDGAHTAAARSTDVRAAGDGAARDATERAVRSAREAGADRIYLKVDSTGRGSLAAQVAGVRAACGAAALIVICPAFPAVGRTVAGGRLHVNGRDAAAGAAGTDPITALRTSDLTDLVPGARAVDRLDPQTTGTVVLDAATEPHLDRIAAALAALEHRRTVVAVGSAGLARALAHVWHREPRPVAVPAPSADLVVVSSLHPATRAQVAHARAHGVAHGELDVARMSDAELAAAIRALIAADGPAIVATATERDRDLHGVAAQDLARRLGTAAARAVQDTDPHVLGLVGGDGASAVLAALGAARARVAGRLAPGVPLLRLDGTDLSVWTKAGGFGPPSLLTDLARPDH